MEIYLDTTPYCQPWKPVFPYGTEVVVLPGNGQSRRCAQPGCDEDE